MSARGAARFGLSIAVSAMLAGAALPCVISATKPLPPPKFSRDFVVYVRSNGPVLKGTTVDLRSGEGAENVVRSAVAGTDGLARFTSINPGKYYVSFSRAGIETGASIEVVGTNAKGRKQLFLTWSAGTPFRIQRLAGRFWFLASNTSASAVFNLMYPVLSPLKSAAVSVVRVTDGQTIWKGDTDQEGRFDVSNEGPGFYLLKLKEDRTQSMRSFFDIDGSIPVEVRSDAKNESVDLQLSMTDCGMSYAAACHNEEIEMPRACGRVVDSEGAAIPKARVQVYSVGLKTREDRSTDQQGNFDVQGLPPGEYEMRVFATGFVGFAAPVRISGANDACQRPLRVQLAVMTGAIERTAAACSVAILKQ